MPRFIEYAMSCIRRRKKKNANILIIGLNRSGKTTAIEQFTLFKEKGRLKEEVTPTVGFTVHKIRHEKNYLTFWDMSGAARFRVLWQTYYKICDGVIYVVDSEDRLRLKVAKEELWRFMDDPAIAGKDIPLLIWANKKDAENAMSSRKIMDDMELYKIAKPWHLCKTNAITGEGIVEGIEWLVKAIRPAA